METDEKTIPDEKQEGIKSDTKTNNVAGSEPAKTPTADEGEEHPIPYYRFREVVTQRNDLREENSALKREMDGLKTSKLKEEEESEPATWKEVEERATQKALSKMKDEWAKDKTETAETEAMIERDFTRLEAVGQKVTPELKKATLEEMVKTGGDVFDAFLVVKGKFEKSEKTKQLKEDGTVPESHRSLEDNKGSIPYKQIHNLSMDQLIEIAKTKK